VSEVKQIVDNTFELQGVLKLGSDLMTVTKAAEDEIKN
jgi:hypothetical protein